MYLYTVHAFETHTYILKNEMERNSNPAKLR